MKKFLSSLGRFTTKLVSLLVICGLISLACLPMVYAANDDDAIDSSEGCHAPSTGEGQYDVKTISDDDETVDEHDEGETTSGEGSETGTGTDADPGTGSGTTPPETPVEEYAVTLEYSGTEEGNDSLLCKAGKYRFASKDIDGYTAQSESVVAEVGKDKENKVVFSYEKVVVKDKITLTIEYKYEDGTEAATTHTEEVEVGEGYEVTSPTIDGYTPDQDVVKGTMSEDDVKDGVKVTVTYTSNSQPAPEEYTVTIKYQNTAGEEIADYETEKYAAGTQHTFTPKTIEGYLTPASKTITITENTEVVFKYNKSTDTLTIHYQYADGKPAANDYVQEVRIGATYEVESPKIANYTADQLTVTGTMHIGGATHVVIYNQNPPEAPTEYTVIIHYQDADGKEIAPSITEVHEAGVHTFEPKKITGYIKPADQTIDIKVDVSITFTYEKDPTYSPEQPGDEPGDDKPGADDSKDPSTPDQPTDNDTTNQNPTNQQPSNQKPSNQGTVTLPTAGASDRLIRNFLMVDAGVTTGGLGLWAVSGVIRKIRRR